LKFDKKATDAATLIAARLKEQGFEVGDGELERVAHVLNGLARDFAKLDALKGFECNFTPGFRVEEGEDDGI
jgi:hypothetical protein